MTLCNAKIMEEKYRETISTNVHSLYQCYRNPSYNKVSAYEYHCAKMRIYNPVRISIIGYNSQTFSMGVIGFHPDNGRKIFIYITPTKTRYTYVE